MKRYLATFVEGKNIRIILIAISIILPFQLYSIEFVTIGDKGNKSASNGKGAVAYEYQISRYEITNAEYCAFLNSVASISDEYGLFSPLMEEHFFGGIIRVSQNGKYTYECKPNYENAPIIGITWMSAIRYCNWLHYNADNICANVSIETFRKFTEGDESCGAYNTTIVPSQRNLHALYWLPNEDEWQKAAFYNGSTWDESLFTEGSNCYKKAGWAYPFPHIKQVGKNVAPSHYGTYDQQGNAAEWIEDNREGDEKWKLALGGSLIRPRSFAEFNSREGDFPTKSITTFGVRICRTFDKAKLATGVNSFPSVCVNEGANHYIIKCDKFSDEYVLVGDAGNRGDIVNQFKGRVNYEYYIARTELSNASYCQFLNAVAAVDDPFGLYDINMSIGACGGINRIKKSGKFIYECKTNYDNRPVVYVNYYDICRYANWLHFGCPLTGKSEQGTTEGTATEGAYDTTDFEEVRSGKKMVYESFGKRNRGAKYWIPSDDEWYKAAYYDPQCIGNRKFHDYPTQTSDAPLQSQANYMVNNHFSVGENQHYLAPVDSFQNAPSFYGTLQQGGNVWEFTEDWQYGQVGNRGLRGGSWSYTLYGLNSCNVDPGGLDNCGYVFGARLCMAVDTNGWQPVATPMFTRLYEKIMLLPMSRILIVAGIGIVVVIGFVITLIYVLALRKKLHKTNK